MITASAMDMIKELIGIVNKNHIKSKPVHKEESIARKQVKSKTSKMSTPPISVETTAQTHDCQQLFTQTQQAHKYVRIPPQTCSSVLTYI